MPKKSSKAKAAPVIAEDPNTVHYERAFELSIAGTLWDVFFLPRAVILHLSNNTTTTGYCDRIAQNIVIRQGLPYQRALTVLAHEANHAAFTFGCGSKEWAEDSINEELACNLAAQVYSDLREQEPLFRENMLKFCGKEKHTITVVYDNPDDKNNQD